MPKRRNVILGMGALAMGSGAVLSGAFTDDHTTPSADFQVLADALRIEPNSEDDSNVDIVSSVTAADQFSRSDLPKLEVLEDVANDAVELSAAGETEEDTIFGETDGQEPLLITNDTNSTYDIKIDYARIVDDEDSDWGYGSDVNDDNISSNDPSSTNQLSYERVNGIFEFYTSGDQDGPTDQKISPSGENVDNGTTFTLEPEQKAAVYIKVDTTGDTGAINSAVAGDGDGPWGDSDSFLSLLNEVHVHAEAQ